MNKQYVMYIFSNNTNQFEKLDIETNDMITTFSIENIQDITTRKDAISKDITIKGTQNNNRVFGNLFDISRYSTDSLAEDLEHNYILNQTLKCILLENNIQILKGSLLVKEINISNGNIEYSCGIVGNLATFFGNIKDVELTALDSINDNVQYSMSNVLNSWSSSTSKYLFPQIDFGIDNRNTKIENNVEVKPNHWDKDYDFNNFRPALYLKTYLDAIFKGVRYNNSTKSYTQFDIDNQPLNRYSYQSSLINNEAFKKLFIPFNKEQFTYTKKAKLDTITVDRYVIGAGLVSWTPIILISTFNNSTFNPEYFTSYNIPSGWKYWNPSGSGQSVFNNPLKVLKTKDKYLKTNIKITGTITIPGATKGKYKIGLMDVTTAEGAGKTITEVKHGFEFTKSSNNVETINVNWKSELQDVAGEYIFVMKRDDISNSGNTGTVDHQLEIKDFKIEFGDENTVSEIPYAKDSYVKLNDSIPQGIKITDFLKSILTLYNAYMIQDPNNENNWIIEPYETFYKDVITINRTKAVDWTNKIDFKDYSIKTNIALPKSYIYKFTEDNDMLQEYYKNKYNKTYGEYTIIDSKGYTDKKEVTLIFSPTLNMNHSLDLKKLPVIYKSDGFLTGEKQPLQTKLRILYNNGTRSTQDYVIHYRSANQTTNNTVYQYSSMFCINQFTNQITDTLLFDLPLEYFTTDDITNNYDITQFEKYHRTQLNDLINSNLKILECNIYLNEADITQLDFQRPIFIQTKYGNSYFKLLEVEYTDNNSLSNVKLQSIQPKNI
ncbi:hypothetical protein [Sphingobacterium multivorum]|uniref:hypothetical protein n=1 Tax=Sphingobacterium multivorum TaxID=28454 RepID=UPI0028A85562|nr:hypothetical protein [Sphingobacterium multivorum]